MHRKLCRLLRELCKLRRMQYETDEEDKEGAGLTAPFRSLFELGAWMDFEYLCHNLNFSFSQKKDYVILYSNCEESTRLQGSETVSVR